MSCPCNSSEVLEPKDKRAEMSERLPGLESPWLQQDAYNTLESLGLNSFENAINSFDGVLLNVESFCGTSSFMKAAHALDIAGMSFPAIDANGDFVMTKDELDSFIAKNGYVDSIASLHWLAQNFENLEGLCFFAGGIAKSEIEAARDVFYGLSYLHENSDKVGTAAGDGKLKVSDKDVEDYLQANGENLHNHHARGLGELVKYLNKFELNRGV